MTRRPFGETSCFFFLLSATIRHLLNSMKGNNNQTAEKLLSSFYVDELLVGTKTEQEAFSFDRKTKDVMASAERYQEMVHIF